MMLSDLQRWFDENMVGHITHAKALEIIKVEMSATTQAINEIKAQTIETAADDLSGQNNIGAYEHEAMYAYAASLRGEQNG
ncbi:TPA: hypothetical protein ACIRYX_004139 [Yersinia enterocolitica]